LRARILGDILSNGSASVHLFTQSYLPKQQLNRAFAAELLMPAELLHSYLGPKQKHFENDQIQDIADQHGLSYMTVMHSAENRGLLAEKRLEFQGTW
jgi:Zn-dependent peptidase ImmA (M78 family)